MSGARDRGLYRKGSDPPSQPQPNAAQRKRCRGENQADQPVERATPDAYDGAPAARAADTGFGLAVVRGRVIGHVEVISKRAT